MRFSPNWPVQNAQPPIPFPGGMGLLPWECGLPARKKRKRGGQDVGGRAPFPMPLERNGPAWPGNPPRPSATLSRLPPPLRDPESERAPEARRKKISSLARCPRSQYERREAEEGRVTERRHSAVRHMRRPPRPYRRKISFLWRGRNVQSPHAATGVRSRASTAGSRAGGRPAGRPRPSNPCLPPSDSAPTPDPGTPT